eukprot:982362_1
MYFSAPQPSHFACQPSKKKMILLIYRICLSTQDELFELDFSAYLASDYSNDGGNDFALNADEMKTGEKMVLKNKKRIDMILDACVNVVLTTKGIDDMALKYFVDCGTMA